MPLFIIKNIFFGKKLVSIPFGSYGGVCAEDERARNLLIDEAKVITRNEGLDYLELRNFVRIDGLATNDSYVTFITDLNPGLQSIWKNVKRDKRRRVKKAKESGLKVEWGDDLKTFYDMHTHTMKDAGSPTHGYNFFKNIVNEFHGSVRILLINYGDVPVCSWLLIAHRDTLTSVWGSSLTEYQEYCAYDLANWEAIEYACKNGYRYFDIGRCLRNSGVFNYKERWGASLRQLYYQYHLHNIRESPDISQSNPNRKKFGSIWRRLPVQITDMMGPMLRGKVP